MYSRSSVHYNKPNHISYHTDVHLLLLQDFYNASVRSDGTFQEIRKQSWKNFFIDSLKDNISAERPPYVGVWKTPSVIFM